MTGDRLRLLLRSALWVAMVGVSVASFGQSAGAQSINELTQRAIAALKAAEASKAPAGAPAASGDAVASSSQPIGIGLPTTDLVYAPKLTTGGNYFTARACLSFISSGFVYTMVIMTDGTAIAISSTSFAASMSAACSIRAAVGINVTSVSGSSFTWDAFLF